MGGESGESGVTAAEHVGKEREGGRGSVTPQPQLTKGSHAMVGISREKRAILYVALQVISS